jgi:tetratricopeptide (TPR) repeat protein
MIKMYSTFFVCCFLLLGSGVMAQEEVEQAEVNVDDLGNVDNDFKENFFNALAEKGKNNHDRAIEFLNKCLELKPQSAAVHFELGKNYLVGSAFAKAEQSILKALEIKGDDEWLLDTLYDVYSKSGQVVESIEVLKKLVVINPNYEELLPLQYLKSGQPDLALKIIDKLDARLGKSRNRSYMKKQILAQMPQRAEPALDESALLKQLKEDPENEEPYVKLIYLYSKNKDTTGVERIATLMERQIPESDKAQLALYKIYLNQGKQEKGVQSMKRIFQSSELDEELKIKVLVDFIKLDNHQDHENNRGIENAIAVFADELEDPRALNALGDFYLKRKDVINAIAFYEKGLENDATDFELIKKVALLSIDTKNYERVNQITKEGLELYPAQSLLYLLNGIALNNLTNYEEAIEQLNNGLIYLLDDPKAEQDIYQQLAIAYEKLGNTTKAEQMRSKAKAVDKT